MSQIRLFSEAFSEVSLKDHYVVRPSRDLWERWIQDLDSGRLVLRIHHPFLEEEETFLVSVGDPIQSEYQNAVFLPMWMIDSNKYEACGEWTRYSILSASDLQKAERIVLRPVEHFLTQMDIVPQLEKSFSQLGVLQQGRLYQIPIDDFGGLEAHIYVEVLEPAEEVYLDGDDIPLEFEQSIESIQPPVERVPTPPPAPPVRLDEPDLMVPMNFFGNSVAAPYRSNAHPRGFVPFSGTGHVLGGAGASGSGSGSSKKP